MRYAVIDTNTQSGTFVGTVKAAYYYLKPAFRNAVKRTKELKLLGEKFGCVVWKIKELRNVEAGQKVAFLSGPVEECWGYAQMASRLEAEESVK